MSKGKLNQGITNAFRESFEQRCIILLINGYREVLNDRIYNVDWEEERISAELIKHMEVLPEALEWKIDIVAEPRIYSSQMYLNVVSPKEAPRIDFRLASWFGKEKYVFHIEAKNLAECDWKKATGANVDSSHLTARYIDTGIENFINDNYLNGCLTGYILKGETVNVVNRINGLLLKRNRGSEAISISKSINNHSSCYCSLHKKRNGRSFDLQHIFLKF